MVLVNPNTVRLIRMSKRQAFYSEIVMEKNASYYRSFHSLLNGDMYPYGSSKELSTK